MRKTTFIILFFTFSIHAQINPINVVDLNFKIPAASNYELRYGFAKGDIIIINYSEEKSKKLKAFEVVEHPSTKKYSEFNITNITNKEIRIQNKGIYKFRFENNSLGRRICNFRIDRIPVSEENIAFNTNVKIKTIADTTFTISKESVVRSESYKTVELAKAQKFFINSGSNATFLEGKSRVSLPIKLPPNTVKWYYTVSSIRDEAKINEISNSVNLASELTSLIDNTGSLNFAIEKLTQPPGANYCDVYLLNHSNLNPFLNKSAFNYAPIGTRENVVSALVEIPYTSDEIIYLGIKNPDMSHGINVIINVVAITLEQEIEYKEVKIPHVKYKKELYIEE